MSARTRFKSIENAIFLDREKERADELAKTGAPRTARAAYRRLDVADQLMSSPVTLAAAWPELCDAFRLACAARKEAGLEPCDRAPIDSKLEDPSALDGATTTREARRIAREAGRRVSELLAPIEARTPREILWERWTRILTVSIALGLLIVVVGHFVRAPRNLTKHATVISDLPSGSARNQLLNGVIEEKTLPVTRSAENPSVVIDLGGIHDVRRVIVYGRGDREAGDFFPLTVEVSADDESYRPIAHRDTLFTAFTPWSFETSADNVRYVRFTVHRRTQIALSEIEIYGF